MSAEQKAPKPTLSFYFLLEYKATRFIIEILRKIFFKKLKNFIIICVLLGH